MRKRIFTVMIVAALVGLAACGNADSPAQAGVDTVPSASGGDDETEDGGEALGEDQEKGGENMSASEPSEPYVLVREVHDENMPQILYEYNERGDLTLVQEFYDRGEGLVLEYIQEYENEYSDGGGRVTVRSRKLMKDGVAFLTAWTYKEEFDDQGRMIRRITSREGVQEEVLYEYDQDGRLIRKSGQDLEAPGTELPETYEYDSAGNQIKQIVWNEDGTMEGWREFTYDEEGRETQQKNFRPDGTLDLEMSLFTWEYEYDAQGHIIDEKEIAPSGGTVAHNTYEYDAQGGLRKKTDETYNITYEYLPLSEYFQGR